MMMILSVMQKMLENSGIRARRCDQQPNFTHFQLNIYSMDSVVGFPIFI